MFMISPAPSFSGRGPWLIAITLVAMVPAIIIGVKFMPPEADFSWIFALNLLFAAIGAYPFARYCERTKTRKVHESKTGQVMDITRRDAFCRIAVTHWPYLLLAGSAASAVWALYFTYNPSDADFYTRGDTHIERGEYDQALAVYTEAIRLNPNDAMAFNERAFVYDKKGDYDRAIADSTEAIRLNPKFAKAFNNRGFAYKNKGDYERAIADYTEAIRLNPKLAEAFNNRGIAYDHKEDYQRAIADYTEAIHLNPNYATAFNDRGVAYDSKGDYERAIADYTEAIRLNPKRAETFNDRGVAYRHKGDYEGAIADYTEAIRLNPNYAAAFNNRGLTYNNKGEHNRAIADYTESIRLRPESGVAFRRRGYTHFFRGDFSTAAADLLRANELVNDPYAMVWRFLARGRMGEDGEAELSANAARLKSKDWPYPVIDLWLKRRTPDEVRVAASTPEKKCEAAYYLAEWYLLRGNGTKARASLQDAANDVCS